MKNNLLLFFTFGISLKDWAEKGLLDREIVLYKELANKGIDVTLLTYGDRDDLLYQDKCLPVKVLPVYSRIKKPGSRACSFLQSFLIPLFFREEFQKADILKTNQMLGSWVPITGKILYGKKLIIRCGYEMLLIAMIEKSKSSMLFLKRGLEYISYRFADIIVLSSIVSLDFIKKHFSFLKKSSKIELIPNYIDTGLFKPADEGSSNIPGRLIFVGRINREKNLNSVVEALEGTGIELHIAGDGDRKDEIAGLASSTGVTVKFLGIVPNNELPEILNQYPVFIMPSLYENHPKSLLEAMSCGMIVIGTNVDGIKHIITDNQNGVLCEPSADSIRQKITGVFADINNMAEIRENAREYILSNCSLETVVEKELQVYSRLSA